MGLVEENTAVKELSIPGIQKERFRINGDNSKILELNTSDANIITRLEKGYTELSRLAAEVQKMDFGEGESTDQEFKKLSKNLKTIDDKMREQIDYIFDSNVSEVCAGNASMIDPINGKFRWEHIIEAIGNLYADSFNSEFAKMKAKIGNRTKKYTGKKK